jgi:hypothetical protein
METAARPRAQAHKATRLRHTKQPDSGTQSNQTQAHKATRLRHAKQPDSGTQSNQTLTAALTARRDNARRQRVVCIPNPVAGAHLHLQRRAIQIGDGDGQRAGIVRVGMQTPRAHHIHDLHRRLEPQHPLRCIGARKCFTLVGNFRDDSALMV